MADSELESGELFQKGSLTIRKIYTGIERTIEEEGMVFDASEIRVELIQNGQNFSIESLLPEGWTILETDAHLSSNGASTLPGGENYVSIPVYSNDAEESPFLSEDFALTTLLHEIGHACWIATLTPEEVNEFAQVLPFEANIGDHVSPETAALLRKYVYTNERSAWAFALRNIRTLRQMKIDPLPGIDGDAVRVYLHSCLGSYKKLLEDVGVELFL